MKLLHEPLQLTLVRELTVQAAAGPGRPAFVSAASGLVRVGTQLYVVADDELHLAQFQLHQVGPGKLIRLLEGELPLQPKQRKKHKPDLEILTLLPSDAAYPHGALLALGSGSKQRRCKAVVAPLDAHGELAEPARVLDASTWFAELASHFAQLNLEGAWCRNNELCLLQRGNKGGSPNAVIRMDLAEFRTAIANDVLPTSKSIDVRQIQLGKLSDVPLSFTDAVALSDGRWLFSAAAEATDDAYNDGICMGSAIGLADRHDRVQWLKPVMPTCKIEGIAVIRHADASEVLLVTDADDITTPAQLLSIVVEL